MLIGLVLAPTPLFATSFNLTVDHCTGGCGTPPFGTVNVTQNGANVDVTVALASGFGWASTGAGDNQLFKFNDSAIAVTAITVDQTFSGQTLARATGAFSGDGTGDFTFGIACTTCGNGNLGITSGLSFHVANTTIAQMTQGNNLGFIFVADVFSSQTGNTGPVAATGPNTTVPEPGSIFLLSGGLVLLGYARRKWAA